MKETGAIWIVMTAAICTLITRIAPFMFFGGKRDLPKVIEYLGKVLPPAIMGALIIYCLKNTSFTIDPYGIPEVLAISAVVLVHLWKRNTLLSIGGGTFLYMLLIQNIG